MTEFRTIQSLVDHATSPRCFLVLLVGIFAGLGLLLASLGIYGVISYSVTQQTREIGIRMALGETTGRVQLGVIRRTMALAMAGIALGALLSLAMARMIHQPALRDPAHRSPDLRSHGHFAFVDSVCRRLSSGAKGIAHRSSSGPAQ